MLKDYIKQLQEANDKAKTLKKEYEDKKENFEQKNNALIEKQYNQYLDMLKECQEIYTPFRSIMCSIGDVYGLEDINISNCKYNENEAKFARISPFEKYSIDISVNDKEIDIPVTFNGNTIQDGLYQDVKYEHKILPKNQEQFDEELQKIKKGFEKSIFYIWKEVKDKVNARYDELESGYMEERDDFISSISDFEDKLLKIKAYDILEKVHNVIIDNLDINKETLPYYIDKKNYKISDILKDNLDNADLFDKSMFVISKSSSFKIEPVTKEELLTDMKCFDKQVSNILHLSLAQPLHNSTNELTYILNKELEECRKEYMYRNREVDRINSFNKMLSTIQKSIIPKIAETMDNIKTYCEYKKDEHYIPVFNEIVSTAKNYFKEQSRIETEYLNNTLYIGKHIMKEVKPSPLDMKEVELSPLDNYFTNSKKTQHCYLPIAMIKFDFEKQEYEVKCPLVKDTKNHTLKFYKDDIDKSEDCLFQSYNAYYVISEVGKYLNTYYDEYGTNINDIITEPLKEIFKYVTESINDTLIDKIKEKIDLANNLAKQYQSKIDVLDEKEEEEIER